MSVLDLSAQLRARRVASKELVAACLANIEKQNPKLNAFITVCADAALEAAERADREIGKGEQRGPLHGIPFAVKDQFWSRGIRTTNGSRLYSDFVPDADATVVARMLHAGAILVGKLNMMELGFGPTLEPPYGVPRNPWDLSRTPGGSSSGSASAIATDLVPVTLGADAGGSIRLPAALCGVTGMKPSRGRVSRYGLMSFGGWFDCAGPLARSASDCAIVLGAIAGLDANDPQSSSDGVPDYLAACNENIKGMRIGVVREFLETDQLQPDARSAFEAALGTLKELGASVQAVSIANIDLASTAQTVIAEPEAAAWYRQHLMERPGDIDVLPRCRLFAASLIPASFRARAVRFVQLLQQQVDETLGNVDVLVSPTTTGGAPPITAARIRSKEEAWRTVFGGRNLCTSPFSLSGHPAISIPCGFTNEHLPVGLQIIGKTFDEATLFRVAASFQNVTEWHRVSPYTIARL
ncbi:MAG TPA: amidase [Candidatus Baltobacteraceae bacterium]